jgi:hypothetical protein
MTAWTSAVEPLGSPFTATAALAASGLSEGLDQQVARAAVDGGAPGEADHRVHVARDETGTGHPLERAQRRLDACARFCLPAFPPEGSLPG